MRTSVIIPAHNAATTLPDALRSVFGQRLPPAEVIVVNDGSTDTTERVARAWHPSVVYLAQAHAGPAAARNAGMRIAQGDLIAFLDADDYWQPAFLEQCTRFLREHPQAVAVSTGLLTRMADGRTRRHPDPADDPAMAREPAMLADFFTFWAQHDHVRTGACVIRRDVIAHAGGQRPELWIGEDLEYWGYLATFGAWGFIPEALWVGNSRAAAAAIGWSEKYRQRRARCPDVHTWEARIVPRLSPDAVAAFHQVRGRVAAAFLHAKVMAGDYSGASALLHAYRAELPANRVTAMLSRADHLGAVGWRAAAWLLRMREACK